jgi:zinc protease
VLFLGLLPLLLAWTRTAGSSPPPPGFIHRVLGNGLAVTILPDSSLPIAAVRIWYHVGAANEAPNTRGFAHLFEHVMFGGTPNHPRGTWEAFHHRLGGYDNAHTSWDETTYESDFPPAGLDEVLAMEADRMVNLKLDQENLDNEKKIVTEELRASVENDPVDRVFKAALEQFCKGHPYAVTPLGTKEEIAAATLELARDFYARYYRPKNAHLVVVGPVDAPATMARIERLFGPLPASGETPPDVPSLEGWKFPAHVPLKEDLPPVEVAVLVYPLPPPDSPHDAALSVMNELLTSGLVNHFREDLVRKRHQALEAGSQALSLRRGGVLAFYSAVLPYRREAGQFKVMDETMRKLARKEWLTEESLAGVKRRILRRIESQRYLAGPTADEIAKAAWWRGDPKLAFEQADHIAAVTRDDVADAFDRYVGRVEPVRVYVQPEKVPILIRLFGWLAPLFIR